MDINLIIHTALEAAGLPVATVRDTDDTLTGIELEFTRALTPEEQAQAEQIRADVWADPEAYASP
jgi:hypothetical protein